MLVTAEACERNKGPILEVLREELAAARSVLEVGSGTGQHAVHFAAALPHLRWQPTEVPALLGPLTQRVQAEGSANLALPRPLDVRVLPWEVPAADALFTANTLHIMGWPAVTEFFRGAAQVLRGEGVLCIYGPFNYAGRFTSASNAQFDAWLRARDPDSGIRDFEAVAGLAHDAGLSLSADHAMPANNRTLVFRGSDARVR